MDILLDIIPNKNIIEIIISYDRTNIFRFQDHFPRLISELELNDRELHQIRHKKYVHHMSISFYHIPPFEEYINLHYLDCYNCINLTDNDLKQLRQLKHLYCYECINITNNGIKELLNLITLCINGNNHITNEGLVELTELKTLDCSNCPGLIVNNSITSNLTSLSCLYDTIDNLNHFANLTNLDCSECLIFSGPLHLIHLKFLHCSHIINIYDYDLWGLIQLERLYCAGCINITNRLIQCLVNLEELNCSFCKGITMDGLVNLKKLKTVYYVDCDDEIKYGNRSFNLNAEVPIN